MAKDKKQAILDSALTLFVTQGYHATSTATLAKTAGVATGTLFHHFPNKEAVLQALYLQVKSEFADLMKTALLGKDLRHTFSDLWCLGINWALKNSEKAQFFQQYCMSPDLDATEREKVLLEVFGFLAEMVIKGQAVGLFHNYPLILMMETCYGQFLASTVILWTIQNVGRNRNIETVVLQWRGGQ
ncbi:TetR/AcrR family transcriptional regulator [Veronia nyctiphanis]|uniref:TetR/AcrR family transcriptional regulator n=1 Tax=Veronia nyctiphanis TaxID=1278244 RepID=UPI00191BD926|nr:TetR/AcrR family transcriptional regulator [Veronia nyctiphanis]